MTVSLVLLLGAVMLAWTVTPLLRAAEEPAPLPEERGERDRLAARKDALYESIRDLDFEFAMGKLTEADHRVARAEILRDAAGVLKEIESISRDEAIDRWIEGEVAARRGSAGTRPAPAGASGPAAAPVSVACPACRRDNRSGARFCDGCGAALEARCAACGATARADASFCAGCGGKL